MARSATAAKLAVPLAPSEMIDRFFRRHLRHGKGQFAGRPFVLEPWQQDVVRPIYDDLIRARGAWIRRITEGMVGVPKKNGKTHLAAGLGAYALYADGHYVEQAGELTWLPEYGAEVYNVAGSRDQAKVLFEIGRGFVERSPMLRAMSRVYKDAIEVPETESVWRVLAADAKLAHGPNPSTAIIDEIWVHRSPELYEAFASAGAARRQPLLLTITTAGFDQSSVAYRLYLRGLEGKNPRFFFRWYQAPEGSKLEDTKGMRRANPSRWVTLAYLRQELKRARELGLENQFRRFHLNQWTFAEEQAIPLELWDGCAAKPRIPDGAPVVIAVDAAPKRDTTAIAIDHRDAKGVHHVKTSVMRADADTGYLDFDVLEQFLREACIRYDVSRILVDPYNMVRSMVMLREEGLPIEEFPQSDARMVPASMNLYELLIQGRVRHGADRTLRRHVAAAGKRETSRGWRLHKLKSRGVIDGAIAVAIAAYMAELPVEEERQPFLFV
jgi:phage terminase large subunit-like protein